MKSGLHTLKVVVDVADERMGRCAGGVADVRIGRLAGGVADVRVDERAGGVTDVRVDERAAALCCSKSSKALSKVEVSYLSSLSPSKEG